MTVATVFIFHNSKLPIPPYSCSRSETLLLQLELCIKCVLLVLSFFFFNDCLSLFSDGQRCLRSSLAFCHWAALRKCHGCHPDSLAQWNRSNGETDKNMVFICTLECCWPYYICGQFSQGHAPPVVFFGFFFQFWRVLVSPTFFTFILPWYFTCG